MKPYCDRCHLMKTRVYRNGGVEWTCICCDPALAKVEIDKCHH